MKTGVSLPRNFRASFCALERNWSPLPRGSLLHGHWSKFLSRPNWPASMLRARPDDEVTVDNVLAADTGLGDLKISVLCWLSSSLVIVVSWAPAVTTSSSSNTQLHGSNTSFLVLQFIISANTWGHRGPHQTAHTLPVERKKTMLVLLEARQV